MYSLKKETICYTHLLADQGGCDLHQQKNYLVHQRPWEGSLWSQSLLAQLYMESHEEHVRNIFQSNITHKQLTASGINQIKG